MVFDTIKINLVPYPVKLVINNVLEFCLFKGGWFCFSMVLLFYGFKTKIGVCKFYAKIPITSDSHCFKQNFVLKNLVPIKNNDLSHHC